MKKQAILFGIFWSVFFCTSYALAEDAYYKVVSLDAVKNCTSTSGRKGAKNFESHAVKLKLPAGDYTFECAAGAYSKWPDRATAKSQNREPWLCFAQISAENIIAIIGRDWGYPDPLTAIEENKERYAELHLPKQTTVYLWIEDSWQGVDYCDDNRGSFTIGIRKLK